VGREAPNKMERGSAKYKAMIDKGSKQADQKGLPFSFSKPHKPAPRPMVVHCADCDNSYRVAKHTVCVECVVCKKLVMVTDENSYI
jgi:ribosomal protein S27E